MKIKTIIAAFLFLLAIGCGKDSNLPATHKVSGNIVDRKGKPFKGGLIEFRNPKNPEANANGTVGDDGTFTLSTTVKNKRVPGVLPGEYTVSLIPPMDADQTDKTIQLKKTFTINADAENLAITLER